MIDHYYEWDSNPNGGNYRVKMQDAAHNQPYVFITDKKPVPTVCQRCNLKCRRSPYIAIHWNLRSEAWWYSCDYCHTRNKPWNDTSD